jgi:phosphoribosyl 1,2-cyclic phosphate phosphodiesterase
MRGMRVTFLGTGTSHGIPMIGCTCAVCQSPDPRNKRLRPSILVEHDGTSVLVDATPDVRAQVLRVGLRRLDAVLLTHPHADHLLGLDDLRAFTWQTPLPIFGSEATLADVRRVFPYGCTEKPQYIGVPRFDLRRIDTGNEYRIGALCFRAVAVRHHRMTVFGYLVNNDLAYVTDCNLVPPETVAALRGVTVFVLDGLRHRPHIAHFTVAEAVAVAQQVAAPLTLLTHICHELDHATTEAALPAGVRMAYDGLRLEVADGAWRMVD